jgi:hypothetical protein
MNRFESKTHISNSHPDEPVHMTEDELTFDLNVDNCFPEVYGNIKSGKNISFATSANPSLS